MALVEIEYGSLANSETVNNNFKYLDDKLTDVSQRFTASLESQILTLNTNMNLQIKKLETTIGEPQISLTGSLPENCIWLEGAKVSRTTYEKLFEIYGTTYGEGDGETTFQLPDFIRRTLWGAKDKGYIEAALPNITGGYKHPGWAGYDYTGAVYTGQTVPNYTGTGQGGSQQNGFLFDASRCSSVYKEGINTVQPPAIKVRVYTRYQ